MLNDHFRASMSDIKQEYFHNGSLNIILLSYDLIKHICSQHNACISMSEEK